MADISLGDLKKKLQASMDPKNLPAELGMMFGGARDAGDQNRFGPDVWGRIWPLRSPTAVDDKGHKVTTYSWKVDEGEDTALCCLAQLPVPIPTHQVCFGWNEGKGKGSYFKKERVRCLARAYKYDAEERVGKIVSTGKKCPFCLVLGAERWKAIQVGGVIDMRDQKELFVDALGNRMPNPPRALLLETDAAQKAVMQGLVERHARGKPLIGTIFKVARAAGKNTARVGTNWIPVLDEEVPEAQIRRIYTPIDLDMAYPALDGVSKSPFNPEEITSVVTHILERHVILCLRHGDKVSKTWRGFDEAGAKEFGIDVKKLSELASDDGDDGASAGGTDAPAERGLMMLAPQKTGEPAADQPKGLWGLSDLGSDASAAAPPVQPSPSVEPPPAQEGGEGEGEGEEVTPQTVMDMDEKDLRLLLKDWDVPTPRKGGAVEMRRRLLTHKNGFSMAEADAANLLGSAPSGDEEGEEGEEGEGEPAIDIEALRTQLMDKGKTPIGDVVALAEKAQAAITRDGQGRPVRRPTVEAILEKMKDAAPGGPTPPAAPAQGGRREIWED